MQLYPSPLDVGHGPVTLLLQERVGELGQLAAHIALDSETQPKVAQAWYRFKMLDNWHRTLPSTMQLSQLSLANPLTMDRHTKRSLLQLHILFLGLLIQPYREFLAELGSIRLLNTPIDSESSNMEDLELVEKQCVLAARQSARVASLLQTDNLVRSHCWVSVYVETLRSEIFDESNLKCSASGILALLAARYFCLALRRNCLTCPENKLAKTYHTQRRT